MVDLDGEGMLALWNGVDPSRQREYDIWHSHEHVPERISVPGMLGARRYKRVAGPLPEYLTLYSMLDTDVLRSEPYQKLLDGPTEWSRSMRPAFRGFTRLCCRRVASYGGGAGGVLCATLVDDTVDLRSTELHRALRGLPARDPFVAVHVIERDTSIPDIPFRIGGDSPDFPDHGAILVEGFDEAILRDGIPDILAALDVSNIGVATTLTTYRLAYALDIASLGRLIS